MKLAKNSTAWISVPIFLTAALAIAGSWYMSAVALVGFIFMIFFHRDPDRLPHGDGMVSPADGRIIQATPEKITVFMGAYDVHVNRAPLNGTVEFLTYNPGKFISAFKDKASDENESIFAGIKGEGGKVRVSVKFIAGLIARRIVFYKQINDMVKQGERINMIRFGSRVNIFCPVDSTIAVKSGDKVTAGQTVIAILKKGS